MISVGEDASADSIDREKFLRRALGYSLNVEWVGMNVWKRRSMVAERFGSGRVLLAGDFSLPYDYSLCDALGNEGCRVFLVRSEFLAGEWIRRAHGFEAWNHFYRLSHGKKSRGIFAPLWRIVKAAEHLKDMRRFVLRMRNLRPDVIHFQWLPVPLLDGLYLRDLSQVAPLVLTVHNARPHGSLMQRLFQDFRGLPSSGLFKPSSCTRSSPSGRL